LKKCIN